MEKLSSTKDVVLVASLQKEMKALKEASEINSLKEQIIAEILHVQDREVLKKVAKEVHDAISPTRERSEEHTSELQSP
jgi:gas vesicle protein